jgi:hypothetical protein
LKLTEQYIEALSKILQKSNVLMLPPSNGGGASQNGEWTPDKVATALTMFKAILG